MRAFAAREGISPNTLAYWKHRRRTTRESSWTLVLVRLVDDDRPNGELVIELAGDHRLRCAGADDPTRRRQPNASSGK